MSIRRVMERPGLRGGSRAAYFLGRPASLWLEALSPGSSRRHDSPVAMVTGAGRGLGRRVAQALAREGFAVGLVARTGAELEESTEIIEAAGGVAAAVPGDVSDEQAVDMAVGRLRRRLGPIDLLVNNAGIPGPAGPVWETDLGDWWRTVEINLRGTVACTQRVLPDMMARRQGRIVNITSNAGVFRWPGVSGYSVSKAATVKFTENLAHETRRHGISVFGVHPGLLPIGFSEAALADDGAGGPDDDTGLGRLHAWVRKELAEGRGTDPAHAVELIVRLASGRYDELSGRQLSVDDELDALLARIDEVRRRDLYLLRLQRLSGRRGAPS
jgi:NAD(P)-dependent dehydrogenase (short-subunit alcohol dehydrogenase family)